MSRLALLKYEQRSSLADYTITFAEWKLEWRLMFPR